MNPPSIILGGGGVHGKACWLIAYEGVNLIKKSTQLCEELQPTIDHIWSLILVKSNNYSIEGFDLTEINDVILFLKTN